MSNGHSDLEIDMIDRISSMETKVAALELAQQSNKSFLKTIFVFVFGLATEFVVEHIVRIFKT